jgi:hypothetical protein
MTSPRPRPRWRRRSPAPRSTTRPPDPAENTDAAYEVHAHKDTSFITITLDKDFNVVKTETNARQHH